MPEGGSLSTLSLTTAGTTARVRPGDASGPRSSELPFNIVTAQVRNRGGGGLRDMAYGSIDMKQRREAMLCQGHQINIFITKYLRFYHRGCGL